VDAVISVELSGWSQVVRMRWVAPLAAVLAAATFLRLGHGADAAAWAVVQVVLVALAAHDLATRRLPNAITVSGSLLVLALRAAFVPHELARTVLAGALAFLVFLTLALAFRGALGMGDVKLAGLIGCLLGGTVIPALAIGVAAGGVASAALLLTSRATRHSAIAYGPYLAFGAAVAILALHPPGLA
jgi:leader peptidase (prepilin peptidase) / N-methyltransferase